MINYYDHFNFPEIQDVLLPLAHEIGAAVILMKPVGDGLLWRSAEQAFRYAFSQPVSIVVAGINNMAMLEKDLEYANNFTPMNSEDIEVLYTDAEELGSYVCRQCDKCLPCPEGVPITEIFQLEGYYDRQMGDGVITNASDYALKERLRFWFGNKDMAINLYKNLSIKADSCTECGICTPKCPYDIDIIRKLSICDYKLGEKEIF